MAADADADADVEVDVEVESRRRPAHIACVGLATSHHVFQIETLDDIHGSHQATNFAQIDGGAAASAAVAILDLGGRASFVGCVGHDTIGDRVLIRLADAGVDVKGSQRVDHVTPAGVVLIDRTGDWAEFTYVPAEYFVGSGGFALSMIGIDAVLVDDSWVDAATSMLSAARAAGLPGVANVNRALTNDELTDVLELATHVLFTRDALAAASGTTNAEMGLGYIHARTEAWIGVTKGTQGSSWIDGHGLEHVAAFDVGVVDSFGAGNVFRGAFALALGEGQASHDAIRFATAAAAVVCTCSGGAEGAANRDDVEELLASGPHDLV